MPIRLDHTIVASWDREASARFLTEMLGLPPPWLLGPFAVVQVGETKLDFVQAEGEVEPRHFAFRVGEADFDAIFARLRERGLPYWADPFHRQPGRINRWDDGRGLYFDDPSGHLLEILTRPYGSGGRQAAHPNPLLRLDGGTGP